MRLRAASGGGGEDDYGLGGDGEVAGVHAGRRRRRSGATVNWGDGGEGEGFGEEVMAGGRGWGDRCLSET